MKYPQPLALFDNLIQLKKTNTNWINKILEKFTINQNIINKEYELTRTFLLSYAGSEDTYNSYRREIERLLQWSWLVEEKSICELNRNDLVNFIDFTQKPPKNWISTKTVSRFTEKENGERVHNVEWRPFTVRISKYQTKLGCNPEIENYKLANNSIAAIFAALSTYFTFLQQEQYILVNPVQLIRQKNRFIQRNTHTRVTRKLSHLQWQYLIEKTEYLARNNREFERHLFILSAFYLLGLRISELSETPRRCPIMGDFAPDQYGNWWFTTVGKGNKYREVAVPDSMLDALKRYRNAIGLSSLPHRGENTPLIPKLKGRGNIGTRQVRNLVQSCFDYAIEAMRNEGEEDQAQDLAIATVHWLRHTAISADVENRPREHVRDDAGHENSSITDRYIDTDRIARHQSAKNKPLKPYNDK